MSGTKKFLIIFAIGYVVLASGGLALWAPPGYSNEYLEAHKAGHEKFMGIIKSTAYKQHMQQGDAAPDDPEMIEQATFVADYTSTPEFKAETKRRAMYSYYFGFLNAGGLMVIAVRFGRAPITAMLDAQITEIRDRLNSAAAAKAEASGRLESAQARVGGLKEDERQAKTQAAELMSREQDTLKEGTDHALAFIDQETEDRKRIVGIQAIKTIRKELVEQAAKTVTETYQSQRSDKTEAAQIESFIGGLAAQESASK